MSKVRRDPVGPSSGQRSGGTDTAAAGAEGTRLSLGRDEGGGGMRGVEGFRWVPPEGRRQDLLMTGPGVEEKDRGVDRDPQGRDLSLWAAGDNVSRNETRGDGSV